MGCQGWDEWCGMALVTVGARTARGDEHVYVGLEGERWVGGEGGVGDRER